MNWVRRHIGNGSRLALFALAVQMVLAFGHFHAVPAAPQGASIELAQLPSSPTHDQHAADHCDICAVTAMAGTMLAAAPPALVLPRATDFRLVDARVQFADLAAIAAAFQPRGPPVS